MIQFSIFNPQLTETYRNSLVGDAFDRIDIEAFSKGSVLVDYYVYFKHFDEQVSQTQISVISDHLSSVLKGHSM